MDGETARSTRSNPRCGRAFEELICPHLGTVARLIRHRLGDTPDVEDLVQETMIQAWQDLPRLREPDRARQWLLQIARNRCRDYFKRAGRREIPTDDAQMEVHAGRLGPTLPRRDDIADIVQDAMQVIHPSDRELIHSFYLQGRSIADIAARRGRPEGTVKRQLFGARQHLRDVLAVHLGGRRVEMSPRKPGAKAQPFPRRRPEIRITPSRATAFAVDCQELRWWFGRPVKADRTTWAMYEPPEWRVSWVYDLRALRDASVHGLDGTEIEADVWEREGGWAPAKWTMSGRLTEDAVQWLAVAELDGDRRRLRTFLDEDFEADWGGPEPRRLEDKGRFVEEAPGVFALRERAAGEIGAGMFAVHIGERQFTCLRVIDASPNPSERDATLIEAYLTEEGRTVLCRRYNARLWGSERGRAPWDEAFPDHQRFVVDGVAFVHWYDCLIGLALGI